MTAAAAAAARGVDVAVVGGGVVGAATAAFLASGGARVRLYERAEIASAASGRNSGVVQHPFDSILVELYRETLRHYRELEAEGSGPEAPFRIGPEPAGLLAVDAADGAAAERTAAAWADSYPGTRPELLDGRALAALEPSLAGGLVACRLAIGYPVAPASATRAFADLARRRGADVLLGTSALPAVSHGRAVGVEVDGRVEPAASVVVAAGPWTPAIVDPAGRWRPIRSLWGVVESVRLDAPPRHVLEEASIDIEPGAADDQSGETAAAGHGAIDFSLVTADGRSALGSTFLAAEPEAAAYVPRLRSHGARFVPALTGAATAGARTCARPLSLDRRPLVGRLPGTAGLLVAAGHGPWGISTGPATARMIADLVLGRNATIPAALDPVRFGPIPPRED
jgi:glycine/D-amino acid oxidase-like deaminating enzyme